MRKKIKLTVFYACLMIRFIIPTKFLIFILRNVYLIPGVGKRIIYYFDPNNLRKVIPLSLKEKIVCTRYENVKIYVNFNDHIGFVTCLKNEPFEMTAYNLGKRLNLNERDIILDIGANIGTASIPLCKQSGSTLFAVEASKNNIQLLSRNIYENNICAHIEARALVDQDNYGFVKLFSNIGNTGANSLNPNWNVGKRAGNYFEKCHSTTLDSFLLNIRCNAQDIKLLKIDVEGSEGAVFRGAEGFLNTTSAIIIMEYRIDLDADNLKEVIGMLEKYNYSVYAYSIDKNELMAFDPSNSYENVVAVKLGSLAYEKLGI